MASEAAHDRELRFWAERKVSHFEDREAAALLDALLRERGFEKRWYIETEDGRMHRAKSERKARIAVKAWKRGRAVEVAVPVQREEPE